MTHKFVKVGDVVKIKQADAEKFWSKLDPRKKYIVKKTSPHTGYEDNTQFITQLEDNRSNIINLKINERYFDVVWEEKSEVMKNKFAVGDKVISVKDTSQTPEGTVGYVTVNDNTAMGSLYPYVVECGDKEKGKVLAFKEDELELLSAVKQNINDIKIPHDSVGLSFDDPKMKVTPADFTGIARPILEERKIGKVKMELFDEGFPNAIMEIARVMTWAAEHKGYKPHDWKNLPNADTEFAAAASRHKVKGFIQKGEGVEPLQRTDEESKITHLAHQAFNVLAELELVLTGVIK